MVDKVRSFLTNNSSANTIQITSLSPWNSQSEYLSNYSKCQKMEILLRNYLRHYVFKLQEPQDCFSQCHNALLSTSIGITVFITHIKRKENQFLWISTLLKYADTSLWKVIKEKLLKPLKYIMINNFQVIYGLQIQAWIDFTTCNFLRWR